MSETPTEPAIVTRTYTCHTDGCGNAGIPITLDHPDDVGGCVCGVCGQLIEDATS